ncbi:MAG: hypothetical protein GTO18_10235 [Anaerolineales bacterium]|nr:hypothetical protein [Anaerolineales bacterium]
MDDFPRTLVGGVSLPRLIIGANWFLGFSHTSDAKDKFIKDYQTRERIAEILAVFLERGVNAVLAPPAPLLEEAIRSAEDRTGHEMIRILTPIFNIRPEGPHEFEAEGALDQCKELGATFCMPHQCVTDALVDRMYEEIRDIGVYTEMIRDRGMIPALSTHMPETVILADKMEADVETYIQIYNAAGFLMQIEVDWVMKIIHNAKKPVITIKPLAAGRLMPIVGLTYVWNTIRDQDMVSIGTTTPDEAREVIDLSLDLIHKRLPDYELQKTRSKHSVS